METFFLEESYLLGTMIEPRLCIIYIKLANNFKRVNERHACSSASIFGSISIFFHYLYLQHLF